MANVLIFISAASVVGFVSWLLLQHFFYRSPLFTGSEYGSNEAIKESMPGLTAKERFLLKKEKDRVNAAEQQRLVAEEKIAKQLRIENSIRVFEQALKAKEWKAAENSVGLLLDDSYSLTEVSKFNDLIANGRGQERKDLMEVEKLIGSAKALDLGKYSPEAINLLDRALLIYPGHSSAVALRKKMNTHPYSLRVPEDAATLNEAASRLREGDTIELSKGVHKLQAMLDKGLHIKGKGEGVTIIECDTTTTSAFTLTGDDQFYTISNLAVRGVSYEDDALERFPLIMLAANLTMRNVTVKESSGHGVAVVSGMLNMAKCKVTSNSWDGVSVMGTSSYAEIKDSDLSGNYEHGVDFWKGASGKLTDITANSNAGSGVLIMGEGSNVKLEKVKTESNSQCGVVIHYQAEATLDQVWAINNVLSGVVVQGKGSKLNCGIIASNNNGEAGFFIDPSATVENFISTSAKGNSGGDVIRKALIQPMEAKPPVAVPVPDEKNTTI